MNWLFLSGHPGLFNRPMDLLHIAPEPSLQGCLERVPNVSYLSADYDSALASERIDITSIGYPDERFDAVVCNHVLHYVDDDRRALLELRRILRPGGWALLQVPVNQSMAITLEDPTVTRPRDRKQVFGHPDHARIYGRDYPDRLQEAGFIVTVDSFVTRIPTARVSELGLDTGETIFFCRKPEG